MPFQSMPYAPQGIYQPRYNDSIAMLMARGGDIAARGAERSGEIWGNTVANLGGLAGQTVAAYQEEKKLKKRDAALLEFINSGVWENDPQAAVRGAVSILGPRDGVELARGLNSVAAMRRARTPAEALQAFPGALRGFMAAPEEVRPTLYSGFRNLTLEAGLMTPESIPEQYSPDIMPAATALAAGLESGKIGTRQVEITNPDGSKSIRIVPDLPGQEFSSAAEPAKPENLESAIINGKAVLATPSEIAAAKASGATVAPYQAPREPTQPSYQPKEVLNDAGQPVQANYDPRTGRYTESATGRPISNPRPVPSAEETKDKRKFAQAGPILRAVSELSERINTLQGVYAKAAGEVAKQKAKVNLDDDVAEYESLIQGFTPLVARALGHTGVLTQQDVDSVRMLFPKPGDSKSLRDRKVSRINGIVGQLAGTEPAGASAVAAPTAVNPNTGERLQWNGKTWVPVR